MASSSSAPDANDDDDGWRERWLPDRLLRRNGSIVNVVVVAVRLDHASLFPKEKTTRDREDDDEQQQQYPFRIVADAFKREEEEHIHAIIV